MNEHIDGLPCTSSGSCVNNDTSCGDQGQFCYSLWTNKSGVVSVLLQGCQEQNESCLEEVCTHYGAPRIAPRQELYKCCCSTNFCNRQFSLSSTLPGNAIPPNETSELEYSRFQNCIYHKILKIRLIFFKSPFEVTSHAGDFRGARVSSLPTNACSTAENILFPLLYPCGKLPINGF